jgi:hypothetical protein
MKRVGLLAAAALLFAAWASPASADSTAPLTGAESICLAGGSTWYPNGFGGFEGHPACTQVGIVVWQKPGSYASNQLAALNSLCKAAGFGGVVTFGKGVVDEDGRIGFAVATWVCA